MVSAMQDWYKGVYQRIYLFAKTARQDPVWKAQTEWIRDHCEFDDGEECERPLAKFVTEDGRDLVQVPDGVPLDR